MIKCVLIDDEPLALELVEDFVRKIPFLQLEGKFNHPLEALDFLNDHEVELIFLDVQMPDISGVDFFKSLTRKPNVIFITAHQGFAVQGFELKALDYLVKPVSFERFITAVNHAKEFIESKMIKTDSKDFFFINAAHKIHKIAYNDIVYLEGYKDYTKVFLAGSNAPLLILHNLKYFEELLQSKDFIRVHRSYIVPINKIDTIARKQITIGKINIPVSDNYRERLMSLVE